jgi:hypothetical protein
MIISAISGTKLSPGYFERQAEVTLIRDVDLQCCQMSGLFIGDRPEHNYNAYRSSQKEN